MALEPATISDTSVAVAYIGNKDEFKDGARGSLQKWMRGEIKRVSPRIAEALLKYPTTFRLVEQVVVKASVVEEIISEMVTADRAPESVGRDDWTRDELLDYAFRQFGERFDQNMTDLDIRLALIDLEYGE